MWITVYIPFLNHTGLFYVVQHYLVYHYLLFFLCNSHLPEMFSFIHTLRKHKETLLHSQDTLKFCLLCEQNIPQGTAQHLCFLPKWENWSCCWKAAMVAQAIYLILLSSSCCWKKKWKLSCKSVALINFLIC